MAEAKRSFLRRLLIGPATLIPTFIMGTALLMGGASLMYDQPEFIFILLGTYPLAYLATVATRYFVRGDRLAMKVLTDEIEHRQRAAELELDQLHQRLGRDSDTRPERFLRDLRALRARLTQQSFFGGKHVSPDMMSKVEELFGMSVAAIRRSADLWESSQTLNTREARDSMLLRRETILAEVGQGVNKLASTLDRLQQIALEGDGNEVELLGKARDELDQSLEVARRVEERMREFSGGASQQLRTQ